MFCNFNHKFCETLSSYRFQGAAWVKRDVPSITKTWKEVCHDYLPDPEHTKLRERLLLLEDIHGPAMRKRFRPQKRSKTAKEEQAGHPSASVRLLILGILGVGSLIAQLVILISALSISFFTVSFVGFLCDIPHFLLSFKTRLN